MFVHHLPGFNTRCMGSRSSSSVTGEPLSSWMPSFQNFCDDLICTIYETHKFETSHFFCPLFFGMKTLHVWLKHLMHLGLLEIQQLVIPFSTQSPPKSLIGNDWKSIQTVTLTHCIYYNQGHRASCVLGIKIEWPIYNGFIKLKTQ